ncbi:DUF2059 domain-containing protein [Rheinheimera marina]|uniref:DUF2059 domain-containing protein n=1 Tax=Rheinheimera marina TaxID=1774958 RepID=A0ABV9JJH8_9GAMM
MKLTHITLAALVFSSFFSQAEPAKRETIEQVLKATDAPAMLDYAYAQMEQMVQANRTNPDDALSQKQQREMQQLFRSEMSWSQLEEPIIAVYAQVFSEDEMQSILDFYQSPAGQKLVKRQPELVQQSMQMMQTLMQGMMPKIQAMAEKHAKERAAQSSQ